MTGYSAGCYTALILVGPKPDFAYASEYCADREDGPTDHEVRGIWLVRPAHTDDAL